MSWPKAKLKFVAFLAAWLLGSKVAEAQRSFLLTVEPRQPEGALIHWRAQSATPIGDLLLVPRFQLEPSLDLPTWSPLAEPVRPSLGPNVSIADAKRSAAF